MTGLQILYSDQTRAYTGPELRPHYLLSEFQLRGSALVAFEGPCRVQTEHLVDWEDRLASDRIEAARMIHFLGEFFGMGLREGVFLQRLFVSILADTLRLRGVSVIREGDDLFLEDQKLSVSIVTVSPVSLLLHTGINVDPAGAPVKAVGLGTLGVEPSAWAQEVLKRFTEEWDSIHWATCKVKPV